MKLGAQLYTLRDYTKTLEDFSRTLKKVADIGYTTVQVSGTCEYDPLWLKEQLEAAGLKCVVTHYNTGKIANQPAKTAADHKIFGCDYVGIGHMPVPVERYSEFRDEFLPAGKAISNGGCTLLYHNHDFEFTKLNERLLLERMMEDFPENQLKFTLDTYWVQAAGGDPIQWIKRLKGRTPCVHLKDMAFDGGIKMAPVYEGNMNFDGILEACRDSGVQYLLVEQDDCYGTDPFECLKISYDNLKKRGLS